MTKTLNTVLRETGKSSFSNKEIMIVATANGFDPKDAYKEINNLHRVKRGVYSLEIPAISAPVAPQVPQTAMANIAFRGVASVSNDEVYVPAVDPTYIKWGEYTTIMKIIKSNMFFPTYIAGLSGNGKTMMVEQACAKTKREYVRVQISPETDEDDLIGGFRLVNGETVFQKGPVVKAMERGCILLIDEIDRATNKIMCLQGVLEGNPILLKRQER